MVFATFYKKVFNFLLSVKSGLKNYKIYQIFFFQSLKILDAIQFLHELVRLRFCKWKFAFIRIFDRVHKIVLRLPGFGFDLKFNKLLTINNPNSNISPVSTAAEQNPKVLLAYLQ